MQFQNILPEIPALQKNGRRKQLTLFLAAFDSIEIEAIRQQYNPLQYELIGSHVTLCRELELKDLRRVVENILRLKALPISVSFGNAQRFDQGRGLLLPATGENPGFNSVRHQILKGIVHEPGTPHPHITLIHPRNGSCTDSMECSCRNDLIVGWPRRIAIRKEPLTLFGMACGETTIKVMK